MAIISSYPTVAPSGSDLVLIVDTSATGNPTKTATVSSIASQVTLGYTSYVVELNAGAGAVPTVTELQNTTGLTFVWTRDSTAGEFTATTSDNGLPAGKFFGSISGKAITPSFNNYGISNPTTKTFSISNRKSTDGTAIDGLSNVYVEIRIYS